MTACIPFLKPFLISLESGFLRADDENRRTVSDTYGSGGDSGKSPQRGANYIKIPDKTSHPSIELQTFSSKVLARDA